MPFLKTVGAYIDKNHHLSDIPSESEVNKYGQNLGKMNRLLLKKVEELTLYLIEKDKKEIEFEARISILEKTSNRNHNYYKKESKEKSLRLFNFQDDGNHAHRL